MNSCCLRSPIFLRVNSRWPTTKKQPRHVNQRAECFVSNSPAASLAKTVLLREHRTKKSPPLAASTLRVANVRWVLLLKRVTPEAIGLMRGEISFVFAIPQEAGNLLSPKSQTKSPNTICSCNNLEFCYRIGRVHSKVNPGIRNYVVNKVIWVSQVYIGRSSVLAGGGGGWKSPPPPPAKGQHIHIWQICLFLVLIRKIPSFTNEWSM